MSYARSKVYHVRLRVDPDPTSPISAAGAVKVYNPIVVRLPIRQTVGPMTASDHAIVRQKHQRVILSETPVESDVQIFLQIPLDWTTVVTGRSLT